MTLGKKLIKIGAKVVGYDVATQLAAVTIPRTLFAHIMG